MCFLNGYNCVWYINSLVCCNVAMIRKNLCMCEISPLGRSLHAERRGIHKRLKVMELYFAPDRNEC